MTSSPEAVPFTVDSDIDLGAANAPWLRRSGADVTIRRGEVPHALPDAEAHGLRWQYARGRVLYQLRRADLRMLVEGGERVRYSEGAAGADPRVPLLGAAWDILSLQRGLLPLHSSAVARGSAVYGFAGQSGAGKSTIATVLAGQGSPHFADDTIIVDPLTLGPSGDVRCWSVGEESKLRRGGVSLAGTKGGLSIRSIDGFEKVWARPALSSSRVAGILRTLFVLEFGSEWRTERLVGKRAFTAWWKSVKRLRMVLALRGRAQLFQWLTAATHLDTWSFRRPRSTEDFGASVAKVGELIAQQERPDARETDRSANESAESRDFRPVGASLGGLT